MKRSGYFYRGLMLSAFLLILLTTHAIGQNCLGGAAACVGETLTYQFAGTSPKITWSVAGGAGFIMNGLETDKTITITWTAPGNYVVNAEDTRGLGQDCSISVVVRNATPGTATQVNSGPICAGSSATLLLTGNVGNIIRWESSTDGTSWTPLNYTTSQITVSNILVDTRYRAVVNSCYAPAYSGATLVDVTDVAVPVVAAVQAVCPGNSVTLQVSNVPAPSVGSVWFAEDNTTVINVSYTSLFETPVLAASSVYYVAFKTAEGCQSMHTRVPVTVYGNLPTPQTPYAQIVAEPIYRVNVFSNNTATSGTTYYWQRSSVGKDLQYSSSVLENPEAGLYYIRALSSNGCWSPSSAAVEVINHTPATYNYVRSAANYVRTYSPSAPSTQVSYPAALDTETSPDKLQTVTAYVDGLGRPLQQVARKNSALTAADVVTPMEYDEAGRAQREYLPYVDAASDGQLKTNPMADQRTFYGTTQQTAHSYFPFKYVQIERSPEDKAKAVYAPGESWAGNAGTTVAQADHAAKVYETTNQQGEVLFFSVGVGGKLALSDAAPLRYYAANQLYAKITRDEDQHVSIDYTDKNGRMICRKVQYDTDSMGAPLYATTYYVYNDFGDLVVVLPPEAVKAILNGSSN